MSSNTPYLDELDRLVDDPKALQGETEERAELAFLDVMIELSAEAQTETR